MLELMAALVEVLGWLEGVNTSQAAPLMRVGGKFLVRILLQCTLNAFPARSRLCDTHLGSTCDGEKHAGTPLP